VASPAGAFETVDKRDAGWRRPAGAVRRNVVCRPLIVGTWDGRSHNRLAPGWCVCCERGRRSHDQSAPRVPNESFELVRLIRCKEPLSFRPNLSSVVFRP
jgi:hypothetical protein